MKVIVVLLVVGVVTVYFSVWNKKRLKYFFLGAAVTVTATFLLMLHLGVLR